RRKPRLLLLQRVHALAPRPLEARERTERAPHGVRVDELRDRLQRRPLRPAGCFRRDPRLPDTMSAGAEPRYETHLHDVLVVGAGGAGLRAAIEAAAQGCSVGLICKSLLGKAHTVMAEGGVAAALANTDPRDSWKVHFRD